MTIYQNLIAGSGFLQGPKGDTGPAANTAITTYKYVATAGQTTFTGTDSEGQTLSYVPTGIIVVYNGATLNPKDEFVATNGTSITLTAAANAGDEVNIITFPPFAVANTYTQQQTAALFLDRTTANTNFLPITGGTLTGNVAFANGTNLIVPVGNTATRPSASRGYIRYNTDLNTLESANGTAWANVGSGSASSGGGVSWSSTVQNTSFIAVKNSGYLVNTATGNVTVTLPASPSLGDNITFVDYGGNLSSNGLIFYPNGSKINSNTINVSLTTSTASIGLVYTDNNKGWVAYNGFQSSPIGNYNVEYLIIAGGGGGSAGYASGGGGAGGMISATTTILSGVSYSVTVGAGGSGVPYSSGAGWSNAAGNNGSNSSIGALVSAIGGGGGRGNGGGVGSNGGSGGGGSNSAAGGSGTPGQGNAGGTGSVHGGGGGGGAGGSGGNGSGQFPASSVVGGNGGAGAASSISGTTTTYAGGAGGGVYQNGPAGGTGGSGGSGGGGPAGANSNLAGTAGTTNLGAGGGGGGGNEPTICQAGGSGGSGVVIIRYLGPQRASGGTVTQSGGYTIHTFTSSGTFIS